MGYIEQIEWDGGIEGEKQKEREMNEISRRENGNIVRMIQAIRVRIRRYRYTYIQSATYILCIQKFSDFSKMGNTLENVLLTSVEGKRMSPHLLSFWFKSGEFIISSCSK